MSRFIRPFTQNSRSRRRDGRWRRLCAPFGCDGPNYYVVRNSSQWQTRPSPILRSIVGASYIICRRTTHTGVFVSNFGRRVSMASLCRQRTGGTSISHCPRLPLGTCSSQKSLFFISPAFGRFFLAEKVLYSTRQKKSLAARKSGLVSLPSENSLGRSTNGQSSYVPAYTKKLGKWATYVRSPSPGIGWYSGSLYFGSMTGNCLRSCRNSRRYKRTYRRQWW